MPRDFDLQIDWRRSKRFIYFTMAFVLVTFFIGFFYQSLLVSLAISLLFTYLLAPFVDWAERRLPGHRPLLVAAMILGSLITIGFVGGFLVPVLYRQVLEIVKLLPKALEFMALKSEPLKAIIAESGLIDLASIDSLFAQFTLNGKLSEQLSNVVQKLWDSTPGLLGSVINFALVPMLLFFLLNDLPKLRVCLQSMVPMDLRDIVFFCRRRVDQTLKSVLKGQVMVATVVGLLYMIGFSIIDLPSGLAIGALAGVCRIVPYLDVLVGISLSVIVIITQNLGLGAVVAVAFVFLIVQSLDGMLITPQIVGDRAGLHPGVVIGSVIAFGDWFGFFGVLIAVPCVAIIVVMMQTMLPYYRSSPAFLGGRQPRSSQPPKS